MRDPFTRGFPKDLPVRPATSVQFDWKAHRRNLFDLRLPENLTSSNLGHITMPIREQVSLDWSWQKDFLESSLLIEDKVRITAAIVPGLNRIYLALEVENRSREEWLEIEAAVCMRLIAAPDFADSKRKRTYWWANGKWRKLEAGYPRHKLEAAPRGGFIAVESEPEGYVLGTGWEDVGSIGGNDMLHNICIHTNPRLGSISPGQRAKARGMIFFLPGSKEKALEMYLENQKCIPLGL